MTPKERVLTALDHEQPDRVPLDAWLAPEVADAMAAILDVDRASDVFTLPRALGHDMLYKSLGIGNGYSSIYREDRKIGPNLYQDDWGIKWTRKEHGSGSYCEFAEHPLANIEDYENYAWPDPMDVEEQGFTRYQQLIESWGQDYAILGGVPCTMVEAAWYLRGFESFLSDLGTNQDFADELLTRTMRYHLIVSRKLVEMGVDIIWWGDDVSGEQGPLMNPDVFRRLIKPKYARMAEEVRAINKNVKIAFHSDGRIDWVLDDLVEIGVDILNPLQPDANDSAAIKKRYGDRLSFWGNVDTRRVMSGGTCGEVVREVKRVVETLGPGGGLILCTNHTIQSTPRSLDNTIAYYWAAEKLRDYRGTAP